MRLSNFRPLRRRMQFAALRARPGFSILELTVVLILVGIITAVAGTRVSAMIMQQRVSRAANMLQADMEIAFTLAARNRAPMRITWTSSDMSLQVTNRAQTTVYKKTALNANYGLRSGEATATSSYIEVYPSGFASDTLSISISAVRNGATYSKRIRMSRAGLVKVI